MVYKMQLFLKLNPKCIFVTKTKLYLDNCFMRKNSPIPRVLGKRIQKARKQAGFTQEQVADKVHVSTTYIGFIEQGRYAPSLEVLNKIANALGVKVKDIFPF